MEEFDWADFLNLYNQELLSEENLRARVPVEACVAEWMGFAGATEEEISVAEARLETSLPPSYRSFLGVSNGWLHPGPFIYDLWPATRIAWFAERNQGWIDAYTEPYGKLPSLADEGYFVYGEEQDSVKFLIEYLQTALQISEEGDSAVYLLNPQVVTPEGEWEAWFFANWAPGATRYRSFRTMMQAERESFLRLRKDPI